MTDSKKGFGLTTSWKDHWSGMPEWQQNDLNPHDKINVQFATEADKIAFLNMMGESPARARSIWFPKRELRTNVKQESKTPPPGRYPVYVISKGRSEHRLTVNALETLGIPFHVVIEPQELKLYAQYIDRKKILVLPFSNLGQGSIPARNWVWEHSVGIGAKRHWILDDNIEGFYEYHDNRKVKIRNFNPFARIEDFVIRYTNIAIAGMNYTFLCRSLDARPPIILNSRVYSCILIKNSIPYKWRGRYNEDTDLSIRALKDGWCTVYFNMWLINKLATMTIKGGNTDELYKGDGRKLMAESLQKQHPDCVTVRKKWGRYQHHVDYRKFKKNKLILRKPKAI